MSTRQRRPQTGPGTAAAAPAPAHDEIERRAYRIFLERGGEAGRDIEHWLQAEKELLEETRRGARPTKA